MAEEEMIYVIPMKQIRMDSPRSKRAKKTVAHVRDYVAKHLHVDTEDVWLDPKLNESLWTRGLKNGPTKVTVKAIKFDDDLVEVSLP